MERNNKQALVDQEATLTE